MNKKQVLQKWFDEIGINIKFTPVNENRLTAIVVPGTVVEHTLYFTVESDKLQSSQIMVSLPFLQFNGNGQSLCHYSSACFIDLADPDCWYKLSEILDKGFDADMEWFSTDDW